MDPVLAKLNFKGQRRVLVLGAPVQAGDLLAAFQAEASVSVDPEAGPFDFALVFLASRADLPQAVAAATRLAGDAPFWCAYPKQRSRRYATDLNRDEGWQPLGDLGFEKVRQVALDEDWTALRFRRAEAIPVLNRAPASALSAAGRRKARR